MVSRWTLVTLCVTALSLTSCYISESRELDATREELARNHKVRAPLSAELRAIEAEIVSLEQDNADLEESTRLAVERLMRREQQEATLISDWYIGRRGWLEREIESTKRAIAAIEMEIIETRRKLDRLETTEGNGSG